MSINDKLLQQQLQLNRIVNTLLKSELIPSLNANYKAVRLLLLDAENITSQTQLNRITKEIAKIVGDNSLNAWAAVTERFDELAEYEATFLANAFAASGYTVKGVDNASNYVAKSLMSLEGKNPVTNTWGEFVKANVSGQADVINNQIKAGFINSESIRDINKRIKDATGGILTNRVENLARTGINHYSTQVREAFAEENKDIIQRQVPLVTFDSRLSVTCAGIGAQYGEKGWEVGKSPIGLPPYHYNCRTSVGFKFTGEPSPSKDVNEWLSNQPKDFQDDVLGTTRAEAFRKGVKLEKFTDATRRPLTIEELKEKELINN
jgi:hypothetical protein